jgi:hypothetical protein
LVLKRSREQISPKILAAAAAFAGIDFVLLGEFDHAMNSRLGVDHGVVLFDGALDGLL